MRSIVVIAGGSRLITAQKGSLRSLQTRECGKPSVVSGVSCSGAPLMNHRNRLLSV